MGESDSVKFLKILVPILFLQFLFNTFIEIQGIINNSGLQSSIRLAPPKEGSWIPRKPWILADRKPLSTDNFDNYDLKPDVPNMEKKIKLGTPNEPYPKRLPLKNFKIFKIKGGSTNDFDNAGPN